MQNLPAQRPDPVDADMEHDYAVRQCVGPERTGSVLALTPESGTGRIKEYGTNEVFTVSSKLVGIDAFNILARKGPGAPVKFYVNALGSVPCLALK